MPTVFSNKWEALLAQWEPEVRSEAHDDRPTPEPTEVAARCILAPIATLRVARLKSSHTLSRSTSIPIHTFFSLVRTCPDTSEFTFSEALSRGNTFSLQHATYPGAIDRLIVNRIIIYTEPCIAKHTLPHIQEMEHT